MKTEREPKIVRAARLAKSKGYQFLIGLIYKPYNLSTMHFVDIDDIINEQKWPSDKQVEHDWISNKNVKKRSKKRSKKRISYSPENCLYKHQALRMLEFEEEKK